MFKFIHAADIHLDSPRGGLDSIADAPADDIRHAPRRALENLVQFAIDEEVRFVLIAGDLYDSDWKDFRTGLFFIGQMVRLRDAGISVYMIAGNHDAANKMTKTLVLPDNVHLFSERRPETKRIDDLDVAIHGQSFAQAAVIDDLSAGYPAYLPGMFNIGLLHTCATKSGEHERYAPCTLDGLRSKEYQYWALGHIHKREELCCDPLIVFSGNLQGRHIRETGPKGCYLVTVDDRGVATADFRALDVLRWEHCTVDVTLAETGHVVAECVGQRLQQLCQLCDGRPLAVRIELQGQTAAHQSLVAESSRWQSEIENQALQLGDGRVWIERIIRRTAQPQLGPDDQSDGPVAELAQYLLELRNDQDGLRELVRDLEALQQRLPTELTQGPGARRWDDPGRVQELLDDARQILTYRLSGRRTTQ